MHSVGVLPLSNAPNLDTPIHPGSIETQHGSQGRMQCSPFLFESSEEIKREGAAHW
jgi:hypothetical protein